MFYGIPETTKQTIDNYVEKGWEPGGFVGAFLANDLMQATATADVHNRSCFKEIASYIYNEIPGDAMVVMRLLKIGLKQSVKLHSSRSRRDCKR